MTTRSSQPDSVAAYIAAAPVAVRPVLKEIHRVIHAAAPKAVDVISYRMPAVKGDRILLYYAAFKHHIGVFPPVSGDDNLEKALEPYRGPKGNLQFPLDRPIPYGLIRRIVQLRARQDSEQAASRGVASKRARVKRQTSTRKTATRAAATKRR